MPHSPHELLLLLLMAGAAIAVSAAAKQEEEEEAPISAFVSSAGSVPSSSRY